jgi:predicted CXXCH cytochrome family protein
VQSVHGIALLEDEDIGAPTCNDCHGNHGAMPPNLSNISDVCGQCHINNMDLFQSSNLYDKFVDLGLKQCESCHGEHLIQKPSDELLNLSVEPNCESSCHSLKSKSSVEMSMYFYDLLDSLKNKLTLTSDTISLAETKGMEISHLLFHLEETNKLLIQARTSVHSFDKQIISYITSEGFKELDLAIAGAQDALDEHSYRRKGLFVFSLIITIFVVLFYIRIRIRE